MAETIDLPVDRNPWISPSRVQTAVEKCGLRLKWEMDWKQQGIPIPMSYVVVGGSTVHRGIEFALKEVLMGRSLPSGADLHDRFDSDWEQVLKDYQSRGTYALIEDDNDPVKRIRAECKMLMPVVRDEVLVKLRPRFIEEKFCCPVERDGERVDVLGYIDYMDETDEILDWKTTRLKVSENSRKQDLQMTAYAWAARKVYGIERPVVSKVFLIRDPRRPRVDSERYQPTDQDMEFFEEATIQVARAIHAGVFVPNTASFWCSPKYCPFYGPCRGGV